MPEPRDMRWPNRIKNRKSGNQPEFRFRLIRNRIDLSKFRFRLIRNRIGKLKIRFRLIRTGIQFRKSGSGSGFLKPHSGRPLARDGAVGNDHVFPSRPSHQILIFCPATEPSKLFTLPWQCLKDQEYKQWHPAPLLFSS